MPYITLPDGLPGISGPLAAYPETGQAFRAFIQVLLRGPSSLTPAEREIIAAYVSSGNDCEYCMKAHAAAARYSEDPPSPLVDQVIQDVRTAPVSEKLRALLAIADKVRQGGKRVTEEDVALAVQHGADDHAIHDTVLIAAAFCMCNRYVDGLATVLPKDESAYEEAGKRLTTSGYLKGPAPIVARD